MKKRRTKKWLFLAGIIILLLPVQFLNQSGFCYKEMKYLNDQEIIDRFLFDETQISLSDHEKSAILKNKSGASYPECCHVSKKPFWLADWAQYFNAFWGGYLFEISYVYPDRDRSEREGRTIYEERFYSIDACGIDRRSETAARMEEDVYLRRLKSNKKKLED